MDIRIIITYLKLPIYDTFIRGEIKFGILPFARRSLELRSNEEY